jgi:DNA-binding response OmpR family regulator
MPYVSEYDFLKMRSKLKMERVPVIVVSAYDNQESIKTTQEFGAIDLLSKPISMETILNKIKLRLRT